MTITRNGSFRISPNSELHNNRLYQGKDNQISISRVYSADFECKFAMQYYPFDIQQCNMNFILEVISETDYVSSCQHQFCIPYFQGTSGKDAELVKGMVDYFGTVDLLQYYIISYEIVDSNLDDTHASQLWAVQVQNNLSIILAFTDSLV